MTDDELMATCIADEAANQPYEGKVAVGRVIRNRMALGYESDGTVAGTILKRFQFSGFWFAMQAGRYAEIEFDAAGAAARATSLFEEFSTQPIWADCQRAVADSAAGSGFAGGPQFQKLTARTVLYFNPAICAAPAWASPDKLDAIIYQHAFYHA
jgi:hypothetical protein